MHALPRVNRLTQVALPQRRAHKRAVQAKVETERGNFSSDQAQRALQYQLERSASPQLPESTQPQQPPESYEQDLKRRQTKAREWITPCLTIKARNRSLDTLATLCETTAGLTSEQQDTALKRLLGQSWQVAAAHPVAYDSDEELDSFDEEGSPVSGAADKIAPASSWEDGSILYTSSILEDCSYEDVLQG